ncbi:uncharacterized protein BCR38DRAFT_446916 [Pseudomassariella vexata]|uniref:DNA (cytosine-5-)-methyltransferase n=1 Tax=Pseudomassariella vexata TaxID=1141098 RepID=A0A1Y2DI28_9PEZI|nr:uncharacterized protein BCR38DRAFT_446916 [Pseudomassariella vexata]ORY58893.1 hypothetical protein BCR38DRAFT_446916 [Pseudomassariella vexata]
MQMDGHDLFNQRPLPSNEDLSPSSDASDNFRATAIALWDPEPDDFDEGAYISPGPLEESTVGYHVGGSSPDGGEDFFLDISPVQNDGIYDVLRGNADAASIATEDEYCPASFNLPEQVINGMFDGTSATSSHYDLQWDLGVRLDNVPSLGCGDSDAEDIEVVSASASDVQRSSEYRHPLSKNVVVALPEPTMTDPKSLYGEFVPPAPLADEMSAVTCLLNIMSQQGGDDEDFIEFELSDFSIYINTKYYLTEFRPLHHLATRTASDKFCFDGVLSSGETKFYLKNVPFRELPIGSYGTEEHTIGGQIWIRSELNKTRNIYYKLGKPSVEYERFYTPFLWIADLAKHVVDYLKHLHDQRRRATLHDFRARFSIFLFGKHSRSATFRRWHSAHSNGDFRTAVAANIGFIWKEAVGVFHADGKAHDLWKELPRSESQEGHLYKPNLGPIPISSKSSDSSSDSVELRDSPAPKKKETASNSEKVADTIVTPYIHNLFSHMNFHDIMKSVTPVDVIEDLRKSMIQRTGLQHQPIIIRSRSQQKNRKELITSIQSGDVISTLWDSVNTETNWKSPKSDHHETVQVWYCVVQKVHESNKHRRSFSVIWLYHPSETACHVMKYPWVNELFMSNLCNCDDRRIDEDEVISTHDVEWFGSPSTSSEFFVRQTWISHERCYTALKEDHMVWGDRMVCQHHKSDTDASYQIGDTVLVQGRQFLDIYEIEALFAERTKKFARVRRLLRRKDVDRTAKTCPPNELIYSKQLVEIAAERIVRRCMVRIFGVDERIPAPYDRNGTGDAFYITHEEMPSYEDKSPHYVPLDPETFRSSRRLREGFDAKSTPKDYKLRGLELFCGGGNFGRGLEEGGGIEMKWANDIWWNAIHTYMANSKPDACTPYYGSVDNFLHRALAGKRDVPKPGDVQFISGGSPCQGFSLLTSDKTTDKQRKNQSLVASLASFIDLHRPQYGLIENVSMMVAPKSRGKECVFTQLVCAIVGLGYQARILYLDAWTFGAPQSQNRIFLSFAAPGVKLPMPPAPSHSHPPGTKLSPVGELSNGLPYGEMTDEPVLFKFVSAVEAVNDLPSIQEGMPAYCIGFPDHRISASYTLRARRQLAQVPTQPWGMNYSKAYFGYWEDKGETYDSDQGDSEEDGGSGGGGSRFVPGTISAKDCARIFPSSREVRMQKDSKGWGRVIPNRLFPTITTSCKICDARTGNLSHWEQPRPLSVLEARRAQGFLDHEVITGNPRDQWHIVGNSVSRHVALALGLVIREAWFETLHGGAVKAAVVDSQGLTVARAAEVRSSQRIELELTSTASTSFSPAEPQDLSDKSKEAVSVSTRATSVIDLTGPEGHHSCEAVILPTLHPAKTDQDATAPDKHQSDGSAETAPQSITTGRSRNGISRGDLSFLSTSLMITTPGGERSRRSQTSLPAAHNLVASSSAPKLLDKAVLNVASAARRRTVSVDISNGLKRPSPSLSVRASAKRQRLGGKRA